MNEQIRNILAQDGTKTSKIRKLLLLGLTHREIADLVTRGNRGFVWNVYKRMRDEGLIVSAGTPTATTTPELDYSFRRKFGVEIEAYNCTCQRLVRELTGSWGTDWPVTDTIGYVKETTGMGTFIPKYIGKEVQDGSNYLYTLQAPGQQHFHYYVTFTSKKESFGFKDMKDWFNYLPQWRKELEHPCKITIK